MFYECFLKTMGKCIFKISIIFSLLSGAAYGQDKGKAVQAALDVCDAFSVGKAINNQELVKNGWKEGDVFSDELENVVTALFSTQLASDFVVSDTVRYGLRSLSNQYGNVEVLKRYSIGDMSIGFVQSTVRRKSSAKHAGAEKYCYINSFNSIEDIFKKAIAFKGFSEKEHNKFAHIKINQGTVGEAAFTSYLVDRKEFFNFGGRFNNNSFGLKRKQKTPEELKELAANISVFGAIYTGRNRFDISDDK